MPVARAASARPAAPEDFAIIAAGMPAGLFVDADADSAVLHVAESFARDLERVSGRKSTRFATLESVRGSAILIGVLGQSAAIDGLIAAGKIDAADIVGEWEAFRQIVVDHPYPGVPRALVIVGADRRGAVFGTYAISEHMGVSPWHWFADVPVRRQRTVLIPAGSRRDQPKVRYRGFFINDEDPCFSGWAKQRFGGINAALYRQVFELLLRMKGNYLWPAMWAPKAFAADDPDNQSLADRMGVVMGSSHHEVMMRAQDEWHRETDKGVTGGPWDYARNAENLRTFWRGGIARMMSKGDGKGYESVVTIGMRGDGDEAMAEGTATGLLERIVADQRRIIAEVTGKPASETPQVWALYKEVQDYYEHGMRVPDDVILLFADDNWGQIRRLPAIDAPARKGGYGVYYHFDYVGVPRNYKWLNTNQIQKIWQQMDLAYARGARAMWIANVGDIKPMEYPLGFFLATAWNPEAVTAAALAEYPHRWAAATFGPDHAEAIGEMVTAYSCYASRRKPELIDENSFPIGDILPAGLDGGEFGRMIAEWDALEARMIGVRDRLATDQRDAYFQLVEFPIAAVANLYRMYHATAWNRKLAARNDVRANGFADQVESCFSRDAALTRQYHAINGGKWNGMMAQVHMSYVIWNDPTQQTMPSIVRVAGDTPTDRRRARAEFVKRAPSPAAITIEAGAFNRARGAAGLRWHAIGDLGRTASAALALPQGRPSTEIADGVRLEYDVRVTRPGPARVELILVPTLNTISAAPSRIGISIDDSPVSTLMLGLEATGGAQDTPSKRRWAEAVRDNAIRLAVDLGELAAGKHVLKLWRLDDNVVPQRLILTTGPASTTYLGMDPQAE